MTNSKRLYRPCVGITLFNEQGNVFVGKRIDSKERINNVKTVWQMPQGGIDPGETVEEAAFRELMEEVGTDQAEIIDIHPTPLRYDLPEYLLDKLWDGEFVGQEQTWVAMRFFGNDSDINLNAHNHPEFNDWRWISLKEILEHIVPFKRDVYKEVIKSFITYSMTEE